MLSQAVIEERLGDATAHVADHEERLRALERWQWRLAGILAAASASGAGVVELLKMLGGVG